MYAPRGCGTNNSMEVATMDVQHLGDQEMKQDECQAKANVTYLIPYTEPSRAQMIALTTMLSLLSVIGSIGNTLVILVFKSKQEKLVSTFYILVLSVVDLSTCLVIIPFSIYMENARFQVSSDLACKFYQFLITSNIPFSALIMVAIAFDRYFAICHPLSRMGHQASLVSKVSVTVLACFATSIGIIVSMMYGVRIRVLVREDDVLDSENTTHIRLFDHLVDISPSNLSGKEIFEDGSRDGENSFNNLLFLPNQSTLNNSCNIENHYIQVTSNLNDSQLLDFGQCTVNFILLTQDFIMNFQKAYIGLYVICFFTVAILYVLLFLTVFKRRQHRKQKRKQLQNIVGNMSRAVLENEQITRSPQQKHQCLFEVENEDAIDPKTQQIEDQHEKKIPNKEQIQKTLQLLKEEKSKSPVTIVDRKKKRRKLMIKEGQLMANLKTALMLFVVTVVFIVTYLPAFLGSLNYLDYNAVVHYMYFANNVANPFIYSFMNQKFRNGLKTIFFTRK